MDKETLMSKHTVLMYSIFRDIEQQMILTKEQQEICADIMKKHEKIAKCYDQCLTP